MSAFREQVAADVVNEFLDHDVFADPHEVDGKVLMAVVDADQSVEAPEAKGLGLRSDDLVLYIREESMERLPEGDPLDLDGRIYTIRQWRTDMGMHRVTLARPAAW